MSHVATVEIEINDLDALRAAARRIGGELVEAESFAWWGHSVGDYPLPAGFTAAELGKCHHKIQFAELPGAYRHSWSTNYEVGVIDLTKLPADHPARSAYKGRYVLQWDFIHPGLKKAMGDEKGSALKHAYATEAAIAVARRKGHRVTETRLPNGNTRLEIKAR